MAGCGRPGGEGIRPPKPPACAEAKLGEDEASYVGGRRSRGSPNARPLPRLTYLLPEAGGPKHPNRGISPGPAWGRGGPASFDSSPPVVSGAAASPRVVSLREGAAAGRQRA